MGNILAALKLIVQIVSAIPTILRGIREIERVIKENEDKKREAALKDAADRLKKAQEAGDVQKQKEALSDIVDDFNS